MKSYFFCSLNVPLYVKTINIFKFFIYWQFNYFFILEDMFTSWVLLHIRQRNSLVHGFWFFFSFKYYLITGYFKHRKSVNRVYRKDLPIYIYVKIIMYNNTVVYVLRVTNSILKVGTILTLALFNSLNILLSSFLCRN